MSHGTSLLEGPSEHVAWLIEKRKAFTLSYHHHHHYELHGP